MQYCTGNDWDKAFRVLRLVNGSSTFEIGRFVFLRLLLDVWFLRRSQNEVHALRHCFALLRATATWQTVHDEQIRFQRQASSMDHVIDCSVKGSDVLEWQNICCWSSTEELCPKKNQDLSRCRVTTHDSIISVCYSMIFNVSSGWKLKASGKRLRQVWRLLQAVNWEAHPQCRAAITAMDTRRSGGVLWGVSVVSFANFHIFVTKYPAFWCLLKFLGRLLKNDQDTMIHP